MDDTGQRLKNFLLREQLSQKSIAKQLNIAPQYLNAICTGRKNVSKQMASRLQDLLGVSAAWLLTGNGLMYVDRPDSGVMVAHDDGPATVPDASPSGVPYAAVSPQSSLSKGKPYYNVDFTLGFDILVNDQTQRPDYLIDFPPYNDCDCWVNAHGDSMHPTISSGDIVALKRILDFRYLINGEIYAIVTSNGLRTIKRIRDNGDTFTLVADNSSVGSQTIPKTLVTHVYHVRGTIKMF